MAHLECKGNKKTPKTYGIFSATTPAPEKIPNRGRSNQKSRFGNIEIIHTGPTDTTAKGQMEVIKSPVAQGFRLPSPSFWQGYVFWVTAFEFVLVVILAVIYSDLLHRTHFGRAVTDNGRTSAKLALVDLDRLSEMAVLTRPDTVI